MTGNEIRQSFLKYFESRGHRLVRSSALVPEGDPTLLFTNAGMNQFKNTFLGKERRDYTRAASCQKCMRAGGKHNDLENVGRTARHHTFFEMLGNFSFGDYFKAEAIEFAWELVTKIYGLDPARLYPTIFEADDEADGLWRRITGLPAERILRFGEKDNFWAMGDTGPCGPCSEILYDLGASPAGHADCGPTCDCGRYLEIWNLVFMQYERDAAGTLHPLPAPSIDTGMGLERLTSVLQGKLSNYDTDLFMPLIQETEGIAGVRYGGDPRGDLSLRIIADHSRAGAFLVADGVLPSNEGRGYVLRKILRRALRHGRMLGLHEPFLHRLADTVIDRMGDVYDELVSRRDYIARVVQAEEEKFSSTLDFGLKKLDEAVAGRAGADVIIGGADIFRLYDTYGFPTDLLAEIAEERGWRLDMDGFAAELARQKERARASWKGEAQKSVPPAIRDLAEASPAAFLGYEKTQVDDACVVALLRDGERIETLAEGQEGDVQLDRTPFYAESGGQVADQGFIRTATGTARVLDVQTPVGGVILHRVRMLQGTLRAGETVAAVVDADRRFATACNHTATHLLHAALRDVLGEHVKQAGSLVAPDRLRFDFSHYTAVSPSELAAIEAEANEQIWRDRPVRTSVMAIDEAVASGAMALFGEKYQETVRVIAVEGFSRELCGGTHLERTGQMGVVKILAESSIASGVRRIEAVAGPHAYRRFAESEQLLGRLHRALKVEPEQLPAHVEELQEAIHRHQKELERLRMRLASGVVGTIAAQAETVAGVAVAAGVVTDVDRNALRALTDQLLRRFERAVVALGAEIDGKAALVVMVSESEAKRLPARQLAQELAAIVEGSGGGRPAMAEAGGKNPVRLAEAAAALPRLVESLAAR